MSTEGMQITEYVDLERKTWRHRIRMAWVITVCVALLNLAFIALTSFTVATGHELAAALLEKFPAMMMWDIALVGAFMAVKVWNDWKTPA